MFFPVSVTAHVCCDPFELPNLNLCGGFPGVDVKTWLCLVKFSVRQIQMLDVCATSWKPEGRLQVACKVPSIRILLDMGQSTHGWGAVKRRWGELMYSRLSAEGMETYISPATLKYFQSAMSLMPPIIELALNLLTKTRSRRQ